MSDLETLVVTFHTQLSDVMETVVKTAMYEVTRLVEVGLLQEMKRRNQEVESLRTKLHWAERKLIDQEEKDQGKKMKCGSFAKADVKLSSDGIEQEEVNLRDCGYKKEADCEESWATGHQEVSVEIPQEADNLTASHSPDAQAEEENVLTAVDVKEEQINKPSCLSVHLGGQTVDINGETGLESHSSAEKTEATQKTSQDGNEKLLRDSLKQDPQTSSMCVFPEEPEETLMDEGSSEDMDSVWSGRAVMTAELQHNHKLVTDKECHTAKIRGSPQPIREDGNALICSGKDQSLTSASPTTGSQNADILGVVIKQEVFVDSDGCDESEVREKKMKRSQMTPSSMKHRRVSLEPLKQNLTFHKATVQEVMRLHPKIGTGARLQAAIQQLQRPMKRPSHSLSTAPLSVAHSQAVNLYPLNRTPSTSKTAPPSLLSVQRLHTGDRATHNRTGGPWVSIKTQCHTANSHQTDPPNQHPDSNLHAGPRHLLRCGQCGKCFPHPSNLKAHLLTHTGERPFCCSLCGRSFTKLSNLKAHRRVHTGERPYCCLACGKCFTQKCNLKRHQRIHLEV